MTDSHDIDTLAAEYVLGTLSADERNGVDQRRLNDPAIDIAIAAWEQKLSPLLDAVQPIPPPEGLFQKIQSSLSRSATQSGASVITFSEHQRVLAKSIRLWRGATGAMTALAASLAGFLVFNAPQPSKMKGQYVAVLQEESQSPAFLMTLDMKSHMCAIKTVIKPEPGKDYQLWMVHDDLEQPMSLGVIAKRDLDVMPMAPDIDPDMYMNAKFAVSMEPTGGSPTGQPSGPVMYAGRLVQAMPY